MLSMLIVGFMTYGQGQGQNASQQQQQQDPESFFTSGREISFADDSKGEEITIEIEKDTRIFELKIYTIIEKGRVSVDIYDPENNRQGKFSVGTQLNSGKNERASGEFSKHLREPIAGKWRIKISPSGASGRINIETSFVQ